MGPRERRALVLLGGLAVAGHFLLAVATAPGSAPGALALFDPATDGDPLAHRDRSIELARPLAAGDRIDADHAGAEDLGRLPGVGPALAKRIVADRESHGAFGGIAAFDRVPGVGPALLAKLGPHLRFGGRPAEATRVAGEGQVDLNRAGVPELDALPGIGVTRARAIIAFRDSVGPFRQLSDLRRIPGLSAALVERLAPRLAIH